MMFYLLHIWFVICLNALGQKVDIEKKVSDFGQAVTLLCKFETFCNESVGWEVWEPKSRTIFGDVKQVTVDATKKYGSEIRLNGYEYALIIKNISKDDLNKNYTCYCKFDRSEKFNLVEQIVFIEKAVNDAPNDEDYALIPGLTLGIGLPVICIIIVVILLRYKKRGHQRTETHEETIEENVLLDVQEDLENFVETRAVSFVVNNIRKNSCVLITGPPGSGKSEIANHVSTKLQNMDGYIIKRVSAFDFRNHAANNTKQLFIFDDVIGKYDKVEGWDTIFDCIRETLKENTMIKVIMTSRSNIYYWLSSTSQYEFYNHCDLLSDFRLNVQERKEICNKYLGMETTNALSDTVLMLYEFFPSLCAKFSEEQERQRVEFFKYPFNFVSSEVMHFREKSNVSYIALALLVVCDNHIAKTLFHSNDDKLFKMHQDISLEFGCTDIPDISLTLKVLKSLNGSFITEKDEAFTFINENIFDMIACAIGVSFINNILDHASTSFVSKRLRLECCKDTHDRFIIPVDQSMERSYFKRVIDDMKLGHILNAFKNAQMENDEFRKKLIQFCSENLEAKNITDIDDGSTVLHSISALGYTDLLAYFIAQDSPPVNHKDRKGKTALYMACLKRNPHMAEILLQNNADINMKDEEERTALHVACNNGDQNMTKLLLKHRAEVNACDEKGLTPLHLACIKGHKAIVEILINARKIDINILDKAGRTPLDILTKSNKIDIIPLLLTTKG